MTTLADVRRFIRDYLKGQQRRYLVRQETATDLLRAVDELIELTVNKCPNNTKITVEHLAAALASLELDVALDATSLWRPS
jgi:UDP-3-O-acyl-N-acetylglucosamine deacetylase